MVLGAAALFAQDPVVGDELWRDDPAAVVDGYLATAALAPVEVVLLGTFHFDDQGLDTWKPTHSFDALAEDRQRQIAALVDDLAAWGPDRVCIERRPETQADVGRRYAEYRAGELAPDPDEVVQIAFRLAARLDLAQVHAIDADGAWLEPRVDPIDWAREHGRLEQLATPLQKLQVESMQATDRFIDRADLRDILRFKNHPAVLRISHARYLVGPFHAADGRDHPGPDGFVTHWYNRNLRIFSNLRRVVRPGQKVLVLFGAGHMPILRECIEASPEFALTEVGEVVRPSRATDRRGD